jgi:hypothetical protein
MLMTRPRPYLSCVTWSWTAKTSTGGGAGGGLKGLVGKYRRDAARGGVISPLVCARPPPLVPLRGNGFIPFAGRRGYNRRPGVVGAEVITARHRNYCIPRRF